MTLTQGSVVYKKPAPRAQVLALVQDPVVLAVVVAREVMAGRVVTDMEVMAMEDTGRGTSIEMRRLCRCIRKLLRRAEVRTRP